MNKYKLFFPIYLELCLNIMCANLSDDGTALQPLDPYIDPWQSQSRNSTSRSRMLPGIMNIYELTGKKHFVLFKPEYRE